MPGDPSWDIMPVANPALRERRRRRLIRTSCAHDPVGLAEPLYQLRHRDQVVLPSTLDRMSRGLLIRAQTAISSALDSVTDDAVEPPDIVTELTLRRHEWQIATALRDITDLRVLEVMRRVPRHRFVPPEAVPFAYEDKPQPIGREQTISQPLMVALMAQMLKLTGAERVREVAS